MDINFSEDYIITKHGIKNTMRVDNVLKNICCPECESNNLQVSYDNYIKVDKYLYYYYYKECVCYDCRCKFEFRISNIYNKPRGIFKKKPESVLKDSEIENNNLLRCDLL